VTRRVYVPQRPPWLILASCAALGLTASGIAVAGEPQATVPQSALHACAVMSSDSARLACYDQLAGRTAHSSAAPANAPTPSTAPPSAAPQPAAAAQASASVAPPAAAPQAAAAVAAGGAAGAAAKAPSAAAPARDSFGLYAAEHPAPAVAQSLEARVTELGRSPGGHTTVALEGGAVWELTDSADPLLGVGDLVTIHRAALGSFLLETPAKRTHRVRRLH
jgi:hypothetical protein